MPEVSIMARNTPRSEGISDSSAISYSDYNDTNRSANITLPEEDISDTGEDLTTETLSKGRLKHELRLTKSTLATKTMILENNEKLASTRELELQDEVRTLSRRLALANTRCETAMLVASQAAEVEKQLTNAVRIKKQASRELAQLNHELTSIRHFLTQLPVDHVVCMTDGPERFLEVNVASYSLLTDTEAEKLQAKPLQELCLLEVAQLSVHRLVNLFFEALGLVGGLCKVSRDFTVQLCDLCHRHPRIWLINLNPCPENLASKIDFEASWCIMVLSSLIGNVRFRRQWGMQQTRRFPPGSVLGSRISVRKEGALSPSCSRKVRFTDTEFDDKSPPVKIPLSVQTSPNDTNLELETANKQIDLLRQDKEYLMNKIHNLTERLSCADRDLAMEKQKSTALDAELNDLKAQMNQNESITASRFEAYLRKQLDDFSDLTGHELARIRALHDELQVKEFEILREERDKVVRECDGLKMELASVKKELQSAKAELNPWQNSHETPYRGLLTATAAQKQYRNQPCDEETLTLHKRLAQATIDLEAAREENRDAMLQIQKVERAAGREQASILRGQYIFPSLFSIIKLRTQSRLDCADLVSKLTVIQQKLQSYEEIENGIDEVIEQAARSDDSSSPNINWVDRLEHFCVERSHRLGAPTNSIFLPTLAARRLEHCVKLTKQITQLKSECTKLVTERDASIQEAQLAKVEVEQARNMIHWKAQPADCLVLSLTQTEKQLRDCQAELNRTRTEYGQLQLARDQLRSERDSLAHDLQQVLTRRQNFAALRRQLDQMIISRRRSKSHTKCSTCTASPHQCTGLDRNRAQLVHQSFVPRKLYRKVPYRSCSNHRTGL
ncbi:hypothetical protein FGIG_04603 [Fasciola gigantica]|uniref:Uncharacterized protein n=1 Tax=Fasciola gigantica TaxID=46835 RepID=A0A504YLX9_FASGI|nr:hypothetical protein FGIG_04603 [Fasciola gigantica]